MPNFLIAFCSTLAIAALSTFAVRRFALRWGVVDAPRLQRKIHRHPIPLLGGVGIYLAVVVVVAYYALYTDQLITGYLLGKHVIGVLLGGAILMLGGYLDDRYDLPPRHQIVFPILAVCAVIISGIGITALTNPFAGGTLYFDQIKWEVLRVNGIPYFVSVMSDVFTFVWLMGMMYTTKYLDGLDGLVGGVSLIAALVIFFVSQDLTLQQDYIALFAIIFAGALAGFLLFNFNPASIFLGEGGSLFAGFMVGVLAILSGSKIATALLVFGIPIFDVVWVISRRMVTGVKLTQGDKKHLHHRLLAIGIPHRRAVLLLYGATALFGASALFLQTKYKLYVLGLLTILMIIGAFALVTLYNKRRAYVDDGQVE